MRIINSIILGILSGILGGALGLGGSFIMLPGLLLFNIIPDFKTAVGTILFSLFFPISLLAVYEYHKKAQVDYLVETILFITFFFSAYYGSIINSWYSQKVLEFYCGVSYLLIAFYFFYHSYNLKK
jgi:uncharacterized membrane protein YfcA